jgi:zinc finger FYVE domain-containing protein 26
MPLPFKKFLETLLLERDTDSDDKILLDAAITSCKKDLYHYCRLSGKHMLEVVLETALSSIKREQLLEAVDVCQFSRITLCFFPGGVSKFH